MQSDDLGLVARLRRGVQENEPYSTLARWNIGAADDLMTEAAEALAAKDAAIERLVAERDRLAEALKPFRLLANCTDSEPDGASVIVNVNRARDARQALKDAP